MNSISLEQSDALKSLQPVGPLIKKLAEVMAEVERVAKHGRNDFHKYDYATESDIVAAVRSAMAARGIMMIPHVRSLNWRQTEKGSPIATMAVEFRVTDGDTHLSFVMIGEGQDTGDKATYKALTGATKYALLKLFLIPTGDDPERDEPGRRSPAPYKKSDLTRGAAGKEEKPSHNLSSTARMDTSGRSDTSDAPVPPARDPDDPELVAESEILFPDAEHDAVLEKLTKAIKHLKAIKRIKQEDVEGFKKTYLGSATANPELCDVVALTDLWKYLSSRYEKDLANTVAL